VMFTQAEIVLTKKRARLSEGLAALWPDQT
jgi:hypothetical protein